MEHEQFNQFCQSFPASSYVMQWGQSHVWKVGGKVFAVGTRSKEGTCAFTFKTSEANFIYLRESEGYIPAPYFANRGMKWIQQTSTAPELDDDLRYYIEASYELVVAGLTVRVRKELGFA